MLRIQKRESALRDLTAIWLWYAEQGGPEIADRFYAAVDQTLEMIAKSPDVGVRLKRRRKADAGLRKIAVGGGFGKILLVYLHADCRVELIRVLHGSRDLEALGALERGSGE
ncbi:MAG: type II toxin-antitoxin system RelE/ParE family toxin [Acidobacteria bacterium]|nr:type II toxin-antitoxin system RelE/ParE family toxin [Acidobacteriota bacterium]